jgi:hypothetical protein
MEFTDEQKGLLRCPSGRCNANLLETGVDLVDTSITVSTSYKLYPDGHVEPMATENTANDDNETAYACSVCGHWLGSEANELLDEIFSVREEL